MVSALLLTGMLCTKSSHAQNNSKWYMGALVGPSFTNVMGDFPGNNYKTGVSGGASLGRSFGDNNNFKIQADFMFSLKGLNQTYQEVSTVEQEVVTSKTVTEFDNNLNIGYFEVPLTARYSISLGGGTFPYESRQGSTNLTFFAGPYVAYLVGVGAEFNTTQTSTVQFKDADGEVTNEQENVVDVEGGKFRVDGRNSFGTSPSAGVREQLKPLKPALPDGVTLDDLVAEETTSYSGGMKSLDVGVTAGVGLSFDIGGNNRLGIEGRFSQGMMTIDEDPGAFSKSEVSFENAGGTGLPLPDVQYEQASLQNIQYAGYVTWTYRFETSSF